MYVVKVFLESSFYHHVENRCGRFRHTFTDNHFHPSPPLAANWPLIGTKLNCRQPLRGKTFLKWTSKDLSSELSHTYEGNVNYYRSVHHPIPTLPVGTGNTLAILKTNQ